MAADVHTPRRNLQRRLAAALAIAAGAAIFEVLGSWWSGSLALLSDAGHVGTDAVALALSLAAFRLSERPHTPRMSFGYHRVEVLAALVNAVLLASIASFLMLQAYDRLLTPHAVVGGTMFAVGLVGLAANVTMVGLLRSWARRNINIRGAFLHAYGDALGSAGVVAGAILITATNLVLFDSIVTFFIVVLIILSAIRLLRDSVRIILEASPVDFQPKEVAQSIMGIPGVVGVHDLHVWTMTSGLYVLTGHLSVPGEMSIQQAAQVVDAVQKRLRERFGITHATLQLDSLQEEMIPPAELTRTDDSQAASATDREQADRE